MAGLAACQVHGKHHGTDGDDRQKGADGNHRPETKLVKQQQTRDASCQEGKEGDQVGDKLFTLGGDLLRRIVAEEDGQ